MRGGHQGVCLRSVAVCRMKIDKIKEEKTMKKKTVAAMLALCMGLSVGCGGKTPPKEQEENEIVKKEATTNEVVLIGYVCKKPIYRQTPFGREIADVLLAVNRAYNKSDYIPCIAWGRNARFCQNLEVGSQVKVVGRVQSRTYEKKYEDGTSQTRIAYEVSIGSLEVIEEKNTEKEETVEVESQEAV